MDLAPAHTTTTSVRPPTPRGEVFLPLDRLRDAYIPLPPPGSLDPEAGIAFDASRPLVFYGTNGTERLALTKTPAGDVGISY